MKKLLLATLVMACFINSYGQVKPIRPIQPINDPKKIIPLDNNKVLVNSMTFSDFYMVLDIGFWGLNTQTKKLAVNACSSSGAPYRWKAVGNSDGTFTIVSQVNNTWKMVHQKSTIRLPGRTGLSGSPSNQDGYYVMTPADRAGPNEINDKWWLRRVQGSSYWLVFQDRSDSVLFTLYTPAENNAVNFGLNGLEGWVIEGNAAASAFNGQPSSINFIPFFDSPVIPAMPLGGSYWKELEHLYFSVDTKTAGKFINTARPADNPWARPNESRTGVMTSLPFVNCGDKMTFRIAGAEDAANIKFEVLQKLVAPEAGAITLPDGPYKIISAATGHGNDITRKIVVNMHDQKYKVCRFRITDNSTTGHIIVDDIDLTFTGQTGSEPKPADPVIPAVKPIWGAIDMHTHPMSYLGMGNR